MGLNPEPRGRRPALAVVSTVFPRPSQPVFGTFIQSRMFRVGRHLPVVFIVPVPWSPLDWAIRLFRSGYRPPSPRHEQRDGYNIYFRRFPSIPALLKRLDGWFMAISLLPLLRRLRREGKVDIVDAHFGYPEGYAARLLGRWLRLPYTVTLRGNESTLAETAWGRRRLERTVADSAATIAVSEDLARLAARLGSPEDRTHVIPNGVDLEQFHPLPRNECRQRLDLPTGSSILITVGWLIERKGQHRVIEILPRLIEAHPELLYVIVGDEQNEPGHRARLHRMVESAGLTDHVRFQRSVEPTQLKYWLSAADVFVLASAREGRANVLLEAMACGIPIVTTDVGGNAELIESDHVGAAVHSDSPEELAEAISDTLRRGFDRDRMVAQARGHQWETHIAHLVRVLCAIHDTNPAHTDIDQPTSADSDRGLSMTTGKRR